MMKLLISSLLLSSANGFGIPIIPAEMNVVVDKLVETLPSVNQNDALEPLAAKTALVPFILYSPFYMKAKKSFRKARVPTEGEIDFDAPLDRQLKVNHIVRRQPFTLGLGGMGTVTLPTPLQNAFHLYEPENKFQLPDDIDEQYFTLIHDECYLGKDSMAHECVDFDPMHGSKKSSSGLKEEVMFLR